MIYEECGDNRGCTAHALVFLNFPANGSTNPDVFQPKTFPIPQFKLVVIRRFGGVREQLNKQTDSLTDTDRQALLQSDK